MSPLRQGPLGGLFGRRSHGSSTTTNQGQPASTDCRVRMIVDFSACTFCGTCAKRCQAGAIAVERERRVHRFTATRCNVCRDCVEVCPKRGLKVVDW